MNYNIIIIDDEPGGANVLRLLIEKYFSDIKIQTICYNMDDAKNAILMYKPDIVLLDIRMPNGNGFELIDAFEKIEFAIIFVTAYDEYALRALKLRAVDYLLKPANKIDLQIALHKAIELLPLIKNNEYYYPKNNTTGDVFILNKYKNTSVLLDDIFYITADSNYSTFYCNNNKRYVSSKTLKEIDEILCNDSYHFIRIHKSIIVNTKHLQNYKQKGESLLVCMPNNEEFEVAQRKKTEIKNILSSLIR